MMNTRNDFIHTINQIVSINRNMTGSRRAAVAGSQQDYNSSNSESSSVQDLTELDNLLDELYSAKVIMNKINSIEVQAPGMVVNKSEQSSETATGSSSSESAPSPSSSSPLSTSSSFSHHSNMYKLNPLRRLSNSRCSVDKMLQLIDQNQHLDKPLKKANTTKATQELENLMASLSMYKSDSSKASNNTDSTPSVTNSCNSSSISPTDDHHHDQKRLAEKGETMLLRATGNVCAGCEKVISGQVITALGQLWHPDHFICSHCHGCIGTSIFYEKDNKPYCEADYLKLFSPKCAACDHPILDKMLTALDKSWHIDCFTCFECHKALNDESFLEINHSAYCKECYSNKLAPKCKRCNESIVENFISALNGYWHLKCFVCQECGDSFNSTSFFEYDNMPYCEIHYHMRRGSLCAACHMPINGRCIQAINKKFHPEHFTCSFCLKPLNKGTFKEKNERPYCQLCFTKLFP